MGVLLPVLVDATRAVGPGANRGRRIVRGVTGLGSILHDARDLYQGSTSADCDASGGLSIEDFTCYQTLFAIGC